MRLSVTSFDEEALLILTLNDVDHNEDADNEIERRFAHLRDLMPKKVEVRNVTAFGEQHDADDKKNEQTEDLEHSVLL